MKNVKNKLIKICVCLLAIIIPLHSSSAYYLTSNNLKQTYKTKDYSFKINGAGGTFSSDKVVVYNGATTLPTPTKNGYVFLGYSSSNGSSIYSTSINNIDEINNKDLYANWQALSYGITYDLNGGTISGQKSTYNIEESFTLPTPTKTGSTFAGWTGSNGTTPQKSVTVSKGTYGNLSYKANWNLNTYTVDVNSIIQNVTYSSGLSSFTFTVYLNGNKVATNVIDYSNSKITYGSTLRVVVNSRDGYNIKSFTDKTWTITGDLTINPTWYDDIPPTITSFSVTNLGYYDASAGARKGYNVDIYVNGYDSGTGIQKYQTWLMPYANASGAGRVDGNVRNLRNVLYLNTSSGRTFCAYAIDNAGNEASKCETIYAN